MPWPTRTGKRVSISHQHTGILSNKALDHIIEQLLLRHGRLGWSSRSMLQAAVPWGTAVAASLKMARSPSTASLQTSRPYFPSVSEKFIIAQEITRAGRAMILTMGCVGRGVDGLRCH